MQDTTGELKTNSEVTFSCGPQHTDKQVLDNQQKLIYICSVWTQEVPNVMDDRDNWQESVREICASDTMMMMMMMLMMMMMISVYQTFILLYTHDNHLNHNCDTTH